MRFFIPLLEHSTLHTPQIDFALHAAGWDPSAIYALLTTLKDNAGNVSFSKPDMVCALCPPSKLRLSRGYSQSNHAKPD